MEEKTRSVGKIVGAILLALFNIALVVAAVLFTVFYSRNIQSQREKSKLESFKANVETMKQISEQYLDNEYQTTISWKRYIEDNKLSKDEALDYIATIAANTVSEAHIVDTGDFYAWTSNPVNGDNLEKKYHNDSLGVDDEHSDMNTELIKRIARGERCILGRYRPILTQRNSIAVGTAVSLFGDGETGKTYVLLRVIPVSRMSELWLFPTTFPNGEIGMIATNGDYIVSSRAMKLDNFVEFIRSYNFENDYNGADKYIAQFKTETSGLLTINDSKHKKSYWYYSRINGFEDADILGYVPEGDIATDNVENVSIVVVVAGLVLLLALVDALYILSLNRKYKEMAREADKANMSKTRFLSTMSHDIRTPLNAVIGMTELAQGKIDDKEYVKECLRKISVSGNHLLTLINDVLEISRVESGKINLTPVSFDVEETVSSLESIARSQATGHGLELTVNTENLPYKYLVGDRLRLTQVYLNLLNNAVKYTKPGGKIYFEVREEDKEEGKVDLVGVVKDTGIGMTEEFQKTMYDSFTRVNDGRVDKIQGTGLGLSIVKKMVDLMDGKITCESRPDEGTTFTVRIPLEISEDVVEKNGDENGIDSDNGDLKGLNVLIAEDNDINWEIISSMLENYGIICTRVENGRECLEKLYAQIPGAFDMVFMDIQMPVMNGLDATRQMRSSERADLQTIPVVAMTADAFAEDIQNCIDAGMNAHVAKPIEIDKVISTIRRLLANGNPNRK